MPHPDVCIAGAGIIGLSLALELHRRGLHVVVLEAGAALARTSTAAAGMLADNDPANPPALAPLSLHSLDLYPGFLSRIGELSGTPVPFQTSITLEHTSSPTAAAFSASDLSTLLPGHQLDPAAVRPIDEHSVDPRQLAVALLAAVHNTAIDLREHTPLRRLRSLPSSMQAETSAATVEAAFFVDAMGTWSPAPVSPRKGQMLAVALPPGLDLHVVLRSDPEAVYLVPRTTGPDTGRLVIGATIEDVGFDLEVKPSAILDLHARAVHLLPALAGAHFLESWAGLRPSTADGLPILGATSAQPRYLLATGHFRNGILLAPATADILANCITGAPPTVDLSPFSPARFLPAQTR